MRISDWSSDVCSSDLAQRIEDCLVQVRETDATENKTLGFAEARRYLGRSLVLFLDHILERHAFVRSAHRQLAIFSIAEFDRVLGVGPNHDRYFEIFRKLRSEEHTSELQSLMRISYAVFCLKKKKQTHTT